MVMTMQFHSVLFVLLLNARLSLYKQTDYCVIHHGLVNFSVRINCYCQNKQYLQFYNVDKNHSYYYLLPIYACQSF